MKPIVTAQPRPANGFTLIEVMIVVAIIGIIAAIAYPNYTEHVRRSQRVEMQRTLLEAAQYMQRYHSAQDTYKDAQLPASLNRSPASGSGHYTIELIEQDRAVAQATQSSRYTLRASRTGPMTNDRCGDLSVDQSGQLTISGQATGLTRDACFK